MKFNVKAVVDADEFDDYDLRKALNEGLDGTVNLVEATVEAQGYVELTRTVRIAMARDVLVVAVPGQIGDWAAYIGAVPGKNHDNEEEEVARTGAKMRKLFAVTMFPNLDPDKYRE